MKGTQQIQGLLPGGEQWVTLETREDAPPVDYLEAMEVASALGYRLCRVVITSGSSESVSYEMRQYSS